ncbi:hypothetical protein O181_102958 [Austropuccinia psidii MF-1]|uniref:Uncharacterized protein n=1 Tax=Austropuccinia psidii MF-1 TaxID=1389203 RepID=A0A9Q3JHA8_9BASI|nr:hypothetical protein [Austropuccinia psidii MF-1]
MSEFMIHREILKKCGGDLENAVKIRTTEQFSEEDLINILEEVTTRTRIGSSRVNLKTQFNTPWKDSGDKNSKENSNNMKSKSVDIIRKCHICQSTTHLANACPRKGKINGIDIEKEPDVEKDYDVGNVTGALRSEEGLALSKLGLTYGGLKDKIKRDTLKSVKDKLLKNKYKKSSNKR